MLLKIYFIVAVIAFAFLWASIAFGSPRAAYEYLASKAGKGAAVGIVTFIGVLCLAILSLPVKADEVEHEWFVYSEIYLGIDYTKNPSPMCAPGHIDDRSTSNGGFTQNIIQGRLHNLEMDVNLNYLHHSCAFNDDTRGYDAANLEFVFRTDCVLLFFCR